jgi:hypothetical protein
MKRLCMTLLFAAIGNFLPAQEYYGPGSVPASETIFNSPPPGYKRTHFDFLLPNNNRMVIEIFQVSQLRTIPNLDSLFRKIWADLEPLRDSLTDPLVIRRVDYVATGKDVKIRIIKHAPPSTYFGYKDDELVQMKVDQDTLRFKGYNLITPESPQGYRGINYTVMLLLNNIYDIASFPDGILQSGLVLLQHDVETSLRKSMIDNSNYFYALYDIKTQRRISPFKPERMIYGNKHGIQPYIQVGVQYARGSWIPSAGAGIEYFYGKNQYGAYAVRFMWEPYFFFERDITNKLKTGRNDFVTLKYHIGSHEYAPKLDVNLNYSLGYLIRRSGNWFEPTTFKFSLPGLQYRNIVAEPEFFFNKFFRGFSPSLKMVVYFQ